MLQFWFPQEEFFTYIQPMNGYSEFCRDAIIARIKEVFSEQYADQQEKRCLQEAKEWREKKKESKKSKELPSEVKEILESGLREYIAKIDLSNRDSDYEYNDNQARFWIKNKILTEFKKIGYSGLNEYKILEIFKEGEIKI